MTDKQKKYIAVGGVVTFLMISVLILRYVGQPLLKFVSEPEHFRQWVDSRKIWGRLAFVGMVVLQIVVAVIPGEPLEIAAGYAFGFLEGTALCIVGMTVGGVLVFGFVRKFGVAAAEIFFSRQRLESLRFLQNRRRIIWFFALVFLLPGTPKDLLSYAAGLTNIPFGYWLLITSICRLPSVITSTIGGNALGIGQYRTAGIVFAITMAISLAGYMIYCHINRRNQP